MSTSRVSNLVAELEVSDLFPHSDQKDPSHRGHPLVDPTDARLKPSVRVTEQAA